MKKILKNFLTAGLFIFLAFGSQTAFARTEPVSESTNFWENNLQTGVSLRSYKLMKIGYSLRKCNQIIGFAAEEMSRNYGGGSVFTAVKWEGDDYAIITAVFKDNILTNKYQANLR